jgi:hypothetical protein
VTNLQDDLASLRIDHHARGGAPRRGMWITLVVLIAAAGAGVWFWTQRVQAAVVKTATVTAQQGGAGAAGAVLNASGYVTASRRATVSS